MTPSVPCFRPETVKSIPHTAWVLAGFTVLALFLFRAGLPSGTVVQSMDYNYGLMAMYKAELPGAFFGGFWRGFPLLGKVGTLPFTFPFVTLAVLPLEFYMDWIYAIHLLLASFFFIRFLRLRGLSWAPVCAGTLVALWLGNNLTLVHPGHLLKYGVLLCATGTLYSLEKMFQTRSRLWAVMSGGWLGWMFMHQADVGLFFGLILGAYTLFRTSEVPKPDLPKAGIQLAILLGVAGLIVWETFRDQMNTQVRNAEVLQTGSPEAKWDFATQWSFPPAESMDLIAPGFWGWSSIHETAPYHGVTGQSPEWKESQQGFPNLRLENVYLGVLALGLAAFSIFPGTVPARERMFWLICFAGTLLLSFGKFGPLFGLLHQAPLFSSIRNPNKFLQVFQLCAGILAAFGLETLIRDHTNLIRKHGAVVFLALAAILGVGGLLIRPETSAEMGAFAETPWQPLAATILQTRKLAMIHASLLAVWSGACLLLLRHAKWQLLALTGIVLGLAADSALLGRQYLKPDPVGFLQDNALADFLSGNLESQRVSILQPDMIHDYYISHLFPAHHIAFADIRVAPRLDQDYKDYFDAVGARRLRVWREFGVKYVLAPRPLAERMVQQNPGLKNLLLVDWSYNLIPDETGNLQVQPAPSSQPGNYLVIEFKPPSDRFTLLNQAAPATREEALASIRNGGPALRTAQVHTPGFEGFAYTDPPGTIQEILPSQQGFLLSVTVDTPKAFLRLADRYDPRLRARINGGDPQPLHEVGFLFAGVELPAGVHQVELGYDVSSGRRTLQTLTLFCCLGVGIWLSVPLLRAGTRTWKAAEA